MPTTERQASDTKKLIIYLMAGRETPELAAAAIEAGADIIELGFPFSDPLAEGPVIREAAERALAAGMNTDRCLECLAAVRAAAGDVPLVPMTYAAILEAYGYERFRTDALHAGASSFIIVDLPANDHQELARIRMVASTSSVERISHAARVTDGWLYVVAVTGTTGVREGVSPELAALAGRVRSVAGDVPLYAGFGISTPEQARGSCEFVDGVAIGSRAVVVAQDGPQALHRYITSVRRALDRR